MKSQIVGLILAAGCATETQADPLDFWTVRRIEGASDLYCTIAAQNQIVCAGFSGGLFTSNDGVKWTTRDSATGETLCGITYGKGQFVVVGGKTVLVSTDGLSWVRRQLVISSVMNGVAFGNGRFVAAGDEGGIWTSTDAVNWQARDSGTNASLVNVRFARDRFFAVGAKGTMLSSQDGMDWSLKVLSDATVNDVVEGNGLFVAVTGSGVFVSTNAVRWTAAVPSPSGRRAAFGAGTFAIVNNTTLLYTSVDGLNWTGRDAGALHVNDVTFAGDSFMAVSSYVPASNGSSIRF